MSYQQPPYQQPYQQPPQGYGAPPYGAPPPAHSHHPPYAQYPPNQYGGQSPMPPNAQYPPNQYGSHSPQPPNAQYRPNQYGAPSPQPGYPPPQGYYAPSPYPPQAGGFPPQQFSGGPVQQQPYGAPPTGQFGAPSMQYGPQPTLGFGQLPTPQQAGYDGTSDAQIIYKAMKGFGTDEKALIRALATKDPVQVHILRERYQAQYHKDLIKSIKSEVSGYFEEGLVTLLLGPMDHDCQLLHSAIAGPGTNEAVLNDVLCGRQNADLKAIKTRYQQLYRRSLEQQVLGELSMKTKRQFDMILGANRPEENDAVVSQQVENDVTEIYKATEGKFGTDELLVCSVFAQRSDAQIGAIAYTYKQRFRKDLDRVIDSEFSGHMKQALHQQLRTGTDKAMRDAMLIEDAMSGAGTKDHLLVERIIRCHWDKAHLANVKGAYRTKYRSEVTQRVRGETSGDYEKLMCACLGE